MSDARWDDPREYDARDQGNEWPRVYDPRDRDEHNARDGLMRDLDLPRGDERELVIDRDRVYELDGEDSRTLAAVGAFRIVPEHDLDAPHDTLENLHDQRLVELVDLGDSDRPLIEEHAQWLRGAFSQMIRDDTTWPAELDFADLCVLLEGIEYNLRQLKRELDRAEKEERVADPLNP